MKIGEYLINGLHAKHTHVEPRKALQDLTATEAQQEPAPGVHSVWTNLYHMVFWQDITIDAIRGKRIDWENLKGKDWLPSSKMNSDEAWEQLKERFFQGLAEAENLLETEDLSKPIETWGGAPVLQAMIVLLQHNSYHIGQIVAARQAMGKWLLPNKD
jgi:uncharacterized damage-inducible protein DinB